MPGKQVMIRLEKNLRKKTDNGSTCNLFPRLVHPEGKDFMVHLLPGCVSRIQGYRYHIRAVSLRVPFTHHTRPGPARHSVSRSVASYVAPSLIPFTPSEAR